MKSNSYPFLLDKIYKNTLLLLGLLLLTCVLPFCSNSSAQDKPQLSGEIRRVRLDEESLKNLDNQLTSEIHKTVPLRKGSMPKVSGLEKELTQVKGDITQFFRNGIDISSQAETRPLLPLLKAAHVELPPDLRVDHEEQKYDFYWVEVVFSCLLENDVFPRSAVFALTLVDDVKDPARRTRPIRLFPDRKDIQIFAIDTEGAIGIDASFNFVVPQVRSEIIPFQKIEGDAKLKSGITLGPFKYSFRKAAIEVKGTSDQDILWRYNLKSELCGANEFKSILILKVPQEAKSVKIKANLGVVPCKKSWFSFNRTELPQLTDQTTLFVELSKKR
ncbi:MAG: hypothetical protein Q8N13_21820 [Acidovorax sp.]|nr:hypothetical protein [Acidovorax sp.]